MTPSELNQMYKKSLPYFIFLSNMELIQFPQVKYCTVLNITDWVNPHNPCSATLWNASNKCSVITASNLIVIVNYTSL